jgi:hypothetical protein
VPVRLDAQAVRDVLDTLVDAALPHADGEAVTVRVETSDDDVALYVDGTAPAAETALLRSARRLVEAMDGTLSLDEQDDGPGLALALPRSPAPNGNANTSILSSASNG